MAAVRAGAPGFLCAPARPPATVSRLSSLGHFGRLARPRPMAQTPDGISCELRGKHWPLPTWLGGGSVGPQARSQPSALGGAGKHYSAPPEGLAPRDPLHSSLAGP